MTPHDEIDDEDETVSGVVAYVDQLGVERRLTIRLERDTAIPRFEQLRAQLSVMVAVGRLHPRDRLPTVRRLAEALDLAPGTVARAYRELESEGIVVGRGRRGTFVVDEPPDSEPLRYRRERIAAAADRFVFEVRQLGADHDGAVAAVTAAFERAGRPTGAGSGGDVPEGDALVRPGLLR